MQVNLDEVRQILLALTNHKENLLVGRLLRDLGYKGPITASVLYEDEARELEKYDIDSFNLYAEAGAGFASNADLSRLESA